METPPSFEHFRNDFGKLRESLLLTSITLVELLNGMGDWDIL